MILCIVSVVLNKACVVVDGYWFTRPRTRISTQTRVVRPLYHLGRFGALRVNDDISATHA
jgi:hypothetical protein